jgi:hypothetical protein
MKRPSQHEWGIRRVDILRPGAKLPKGTFVEEGARARYRRARHGGGGVLIGVVVEHVIGGAWIRIYGPANVLFKSKP